MSDQQPSTSSGIFKRKLYDYSIKKKYLFKMKKFLKNFLGFELTQKEFNRKVKSSMMQHIPVEDQHLGMTEMCEKYPDEINIIKGLFIFLKIIIFLFVLESLFLLIFKASLRNFLPKGSTFNIAWSKALHTFRQQKYMERRLKK
jgi:hypothetical protein